MVESLGSYVLEIRKDIIRKLINKDVDKVKELIKQTLQTKKFRTIYEIADDYKSSSRKLKPAHKELLEDIKDLLNTNRKEIVEEILLFLSPRMDSLFNYFVANIYGKNQEELSFEKELYNDIVYYLFEMNRKLALKEARKVRVENLTREEIDQYAYIGLLKGIKRYNWNAGYRITTYATYWIREQIFFSIKNNFMLKYPEEVRQAYKEILNITRKYFNSLKDINLNKLKETSPELFKKYREDVISDALMINWTYSIDYSERNDNEESNKNLLDMYSAKVNNINYEQKMQYEEIYEIIKDVLNNEELAIFTEEFNLDQYLNIDLNYIEYSKKDLRRIIKKIKSQPRIMKRLKEIFLYKEV